MCTGATSPSIPSTSPMPEPWRSYRPPGADQIADRFADKSGFYTAIGLCGARMLAVSTRPELRDLASKIHTLKDLADPKLKGRIGISHPGFGTASGHVAALYLAWGDDATDAWLRSLSENGVLLLGGNSVVAEQVAAGTLVAGLTDNDDIANAKANHEPIEAVLPDQQSDGTLLIPTTVALVKRCGAPHQRPRETTDRFPHHSPNRTRAHRPALPGLFRPPRLRTAQKPPCRPQSGRPPHAGCGGAFPQDPPKPVEEMGGIRTVPNKSEHDSDFKVGIDYFLVHVIELLTVVKNILFPDEIRATRGSCGFMLPGCWGETPGRKGAPPGRGETGMRGFGAAAPLLKG